MKLKKEKEHNHALPKGTFRHKPDSLRQYDQKVYQSNEKKMSQGSEDIIKCMSWPHGENWRPNHAKSLGKSFGKKSKKKK